MDQGTKLFLTAVDDLGDEGFSAPTALPGWTRAHVVAHVHYNAEALLRLLQWARTGEPTPMYASREQRAAEIESGTALPPAELRALVRASAGALATGITSLPHAAWNNEVVTAQGRTVPAREIVWMRTREVAVHAVDLGAGVTFSELPDDLNAALVADVIGRRNARGEAAALAAWLTGRADAAPTLDPWL
ncbi:MAG: maleylpyruvate isomerase N-terminal domain-containing protein [Actinomycetes bacterium]